MLPGWRLVCHQQVTMSKEAIFNIVLLLRIER